MFGKTIWLFGLSGAGKSTLGYRLSKDLSNSSLEVIHLDADHVRTVMGIEPDFSYRGRENFQLELRKEAEAFSYLGKTVVVSSITPYQEMRNSNRSFLDPYFEVYLDCDIDTLVKRDPKGLYKKALAGEISNLTGIDDPFEAPAQNRFWGNSIPDLVLNTAIMSEDEAYKILNRQVNEWIASEDERLTKKVRRKV
jgi:adenylylsulfate kinase